MKIILRLLAGAGVAAVIVTGLAVWQQQTAAPPAEHADPELVSLGMACDAELKAGRAGAAVVAREAQRPAPSAQPAQSPPPEDRVFSREEKDLAVDAAADAAALEAEAKGDDSVYAKHTADQHWLADYAGSVRKSRTAPDDCTRYFQAMREHGRSVVRPDPARRQ